MEKATTKVFVAASITWSGVSLLRGIKAEIEDPTPFNFRRMLVRAAKFAMPLVEGEV